VPTGDRHADRDDPSGPFAARTLGVTRRVCGMAVVGLGAASLVGWATGHRILTTGRADSIPMAPNTGVAFLLLGTGVCLLPHTGGRCRGRLIAGSGAALVTLMCAVRLSEYATGFDLAVDRLFIQVPSESLGLAPVGKTIGRFSRRSPSWSPAPRRSCLPSREEQGR
jgi:hypothetical protein